MSTRHKRCYRK